MSRPGVFGAPDSSAGKISRLAILQKDEEAIKAVKALRVTKSPVVLRLAMAAIAGMFFFMAKDWALWGWAASIFFMLSLIGASGGIGAAAGAITAAIGHFRVLEYIEPTGIFWVILLFTVGGGALSGAVAAVISRRMHPAAFAFLAPLLPAGLEHLGSFSAAGNLSSTALTQYQYTVVARIARLGGLSVVTYVMLVFGAAVASAVRFVREGQIVLKACLPAAALVVLTLLYGLASSCRSSEKLKVAAFNGWQDIERLERLSAKEPYDGEAWKSHGESIAEVMRRVSERPMVATAASRNDQAEGIAVLVWPEASILLDESTKEEFFKRVATLAAVTQCVQVFGYYDVDEMQSLAVVVSSREEAHPSYARLNYLPGLDDKFFVGQIALPGAQAPEASDTTVGRIGVILSLDANFSSNFASLSRDGAGVVCVCGLDDTKTPQAALRLLVYNAVMCGTAVVRNSRRGLLTAISPNGKVVAQVETQAKANSEVRADLPMGTGGTLFLVTGNAFAWLAMLAGLVLAFYAGSLEESGLYGAPRKAEGPSTSSGLTYKTRDGLKNL